MASIKDLIEAGHIQFVPGDIGDRALVETLLWAAQIGGNRCCPKWL